MPGAGVNACPAGPASALPGRRLRPGGIEAGCSDPAYWAELAGVLGALDRRINRTPGIAPDNPPGVGLMFDVVEKDGQCHYRMRRALRDVLEVQQPLWLHLKA